MIIPRNNLVVIKLIKQAELQVGKIVVPTSSDLYCEAEVRAVGPGCVLAHGARPDTFDLKVGQHVWVKHQDIRQTGQGLVKAAAGIEYKQDGEVLFLVPENFIIGIIAFPEEVKPVLPS